MMEVKPESKSFTGSSRNAAMAFTICRARSWTTRTNYLASICLSNSAYFLVPSDTATKLNVISGC